jgi:hypothetical protein
MSKETQVGIGVGIGVGVPILLIIALIPWFLRRRRNKAGASTNPNGSRGAIHSDHKHELDARNSRLNAAAQGNFGNAQLSELNAQPAIHEMGTGR